MIVSLSYCLNRTLYHPKRTVGERLYSLSCFEEVSRFLNTGTLGSNYSLVFTESEVIRLVECLKEAKVFLDILTTADGFLTSIVFGI